jgi:hypothetical protein
MRHNQTQPEGPSMPKLSLLNPDNHALLLIDHQYLQLLTLRSHESAQVISNVQAVAKASKIFNVPTLLTWSRRFRMSIPSKPQLTEQP